MATTPPTRGLENVVAAESALAEIDGTAGTLRYRGYDIHDLANGASFEEVIALLWDGELAFASALETLKHELAQRRVLPGSILQLLQNLPRRTLPMDALRTAVSALAAEDDFAEETDPSAARQIALHLAAQIPMILAAFGRIRQNLEPLPPRDG